MDALEKEASSGLITEAARMTRLEKCIDAVANAAGSSQASSNGVMDDLMQSIEKVGRNRVLCAIVRKYIGIGGRSGG